MISWIKKRFRTLAEFGAQRNTARQCLSALGFPQPIGISQLCCPAIFGFVSVRYHVCGRVGRRHCWAAIDKLQRRTFKDAGEIVTLLNRKSVSRQIVEGLTSSVVENLTQCNGFMI